MQNPDDLGHGFDLLNCSYATPIADAARAALRDCAAIAPLIRERYWGPWPSQEDLLSMPCGSLGHRFASWFVTPAASPCMPPSWMRGPMETTSGSKPRL